MYCDCFCCYKNYRCIFLCCIFNCFHIKPMRKRNKIKIKKVDWDKVITREYPLSRP